MKNAAKTAFVFDAFNSWTHVLYLKGVSMAAKAATKSEILQGIAAATDLSRKQVSSVFNALSEQIGKNVGKKGPGVFVVPGLMKIMVITKPATKAREGINPFTKEKTMFKAKPARKVIKVRPLKALKDMAK
jgi:nucleoid DNA-binding protein